MPHKKNLATSTIFLSVIFFKFHAQNFMVSKVNFCRFTIRCYIAVRRKALCLYWRRLPRPTSSKAEISFCSWREAFGQKRRHTVNVIPSNIKPYGVSYSLSQSSINIRYPIWERNQKIKFMSYCLKCLNLD